MKKCLKCLKLCHLRRNNLSELCDSEHVCCRYKAYLFGILKCQHTSTLDTLAHFRVCPITSVIFIKQAEVMFLLPDQIFLFKCIILLI